MPKPYARLDHLLLASAAMGLALAVTAPYRVAAAADICAAASTSVSSAQGGGDNCILDAGQSVDITAAGSIGHTGGDGILVQNTAGSVTNAGSVTGTDDGVDVNPTGSLTGGIANAAGGTISGNVFGINVNGGGTVAGGISNSGDITGATDAIVIDNTSSVTGGVSNSGTITGTGDDGITIEDRSSVTGDLTNAAGGLIDATGDGIFMDDTVTINGSIVNAGTIDADDDGMHLISDATVTGSIQNLGTITAGNDGIELSETTVVNGSITNSGTITAADSGIEISTDATIDGNITNSGTITATGDGIRFGGGSSSLAGNITNSGTITSSTTDGVIVSDSSTVTGSIVNSGTITGASSGVFVTSAGVGGIANQAGGTITGATNSIQIISSAAPITITNAGVLDGDVALYDGTLNLNGSSTRVDGNISGLGSSSVNVNGDFATEGTIGVGTLAVGSSGELTLANDVTVTSFSNGGTVAIADGTARNVTGAYTQGSGGTLRIGASSASSFGQLVVSGAADFSASNALHVVVDANHSFASGDQLADVVQAGTLTASSVTVTDTSALLVFTGSIDSNTVDLEVAVRSVEDIVDGGSGGGAAGALDEIIADSPIGDAATVVDALNSLPSDQAMQDAVQELLPAITGGHAQGNVVAAQAGATNVVQDRLIRLSGLNAGDALLADPVAWIKPFAADTSQGSRGGVSGFDGLTIGAAVGVDAQWGDDLRAGLAISYADSVIDGRGVSDSSVDLDTVQVTAYGTYDINPKTHLNLLGALGWNDNDSRRAIDFGGLDRIAEADYHSWHGIVDAEVVRSYKLQSGLGFMPSLAATYTYARAEDYSETGAGAANLDVDDADADSLVLGAAGRLIYAVHEAINVSGNLGLTYDVLAGDEQVTATFEGGGGAFVTESLDPAPFGLTGGVGLELVPEIGIDASLNYDIEARDDYRSHKVQLNLRFPF